jgi:uncharacterized membrane protein
MHDLWGMNGTILPMKLDVPSKKKFIIVVIVLIIVAISLIIFIIKSFSTTPPFQEHSVQNSSATANIQTQYFAGSINGQKIHLIAQLQTQELPNRYDYDCMYVRDNVDATAQECQFSFSSGGRFEIELKDDSDTLIGYECDPASERGAFISICSSSEEGSTPFRLDGVSSFSLDQFVKN